MKIIREAEEKKGKKEVEVTTDTEDKLKKKIIKLLKNDGKGHHHAKWAARLEDFILKIVPRSEKPTFVAAMSWPDITIYVSDGFVTNDPDIFYQLSVLMRHELAHYLLQHDIRMAKYIQDKYGEEYWKHYKLSNLLHEGLNIIMDFEISNKVYTQEDDKDVVRNLHDSARYLPGLVTETLTNGWEDKNLIEMYEAVEDTIDQVKKSILAKWDALDLTSMISTSKKDYVRNFVVGKLHSYSDINHPTGFFCTLDEFIAGTKKNALYHFAPFDDGNSICVAKFTSLSNFYQEIIVKIAKEFVAANGYTRQDVRDRVAEIGKTSPLEPYSLKTNKKKELIKIYNPEEKFLAIDALKAMLHSLDEYDTWYAKIQKVLSDTKYSDADRQRILDEINK